MSSKGKDIAGKYIRGAVSRREFLRTTAALGLGAVATQKLLSQAVTSAMAETAFDWKKHAGTKIRVLLDKHPYVDALIANLDSFKELTGIDIAYDVFPEDVYFDKVTAVLSSRSSEYDVFQTGAYMNWTYGPAGWIVDLNEYLQDADKTSPTYNWEDILQSLRESCAWDGVPGSALGGEGSMQWCLPWGHEINSISYNKRYFDQVGVDLPNSMGELIEVSAKLKTDLGGQAYGFGARGSRSWATIHPGFLSGYANFGQKDFVMEDGRIAAGMATDGSKDYHRQFVQLIQESGPANWSSYTWYQVGADLGSGASAMFYDADIVGYFMNGEGNKEAGNIGFHAFAPNPETEQPTPNVWIFGLSMSNFSNNKDAAWYFMQWATSYEHCLFGAVKMDFVDPIRASVWANDEFRGRMGSYEGYIEQYEKSAAGAKIQFTPQPLFFDLATDWAATLQRMVLKEVPVDEGLEQFANEVNRQLADAGLR